MEKNVNINYDNYFKGEKFKTLNEKYLPKTGEGETMANQIVIAVNRIIESYDTDGLTFTTTTIFENYDDKALNCADWLFKYTKGDFLSNIYEFSFTEDYDYIIEDLLDWGMDEETLKDFEDEPRVGHVYDCDGFFNYVKNHIEDSQITKRKIKRLIKKFKGI